MLGDAELAQKFAAQMLKENIYGIGFSFPVVPQGQSRIRTQMSAAHSRKDVESAVQAFKKVGQQLRIIK
jgi:glycine C-acetyltransferase